MKWYFITSFFLIAVVFKSYSQDKNSSYYIKFLKNWSEYVSIPDRNENNIKISITVDDHVLYSEAVSLGLREIQKHKIFYFKLKNQYKEAISGRLLFEYIGVDGEERKMNCVLYCLEPGEVYFNWLYGIKNVSKILSIKFIEFKSCEKKSNLLVYEARDSLIFKVIENRQQFVNLVSSNGSNYNKNAKAESVSSGSSTDKAVKNHVNDKNFSDDHVDYTGRHETQIKTLLSKVRGWKTNSGLQIKDGIPPSIQAGICQRDQYVGAAVLYSWAAESYFRLNEKEKALNMAEKVYNSLSAANALCSDAPSFGGQGECTTEKIYPCGQKFDINSSTANISSGATGSSSKGNEPLVSKEEGEIILGLFAMASGKADANFIADYSNKLSAYADKSDLEPGVKFLIKLSAFQNQLQLQELTSNSGVSIASPSSPNKGLSQSYAGTSRTGGMSTLEQQQVLREQLTAIWNLFATEGPSRKTFRRQEELETMTKLKDREYRQKYGYSVSNYAEAIRNFDDATLNKILQSGFPISTTVQHNNEFADITYEFEDYNAKDYYFTGLEYAAIYGNTYAIKRLLELGANPNYLIDGMLGANNWYSWYHKYAAVHVAIFYDRFEAVKLLLPNTTMSKRFGNRDKPYEFAKDRQYFHILTLLEPFK